MIRACGRVAFSLAMLSCYALAQTQTLSEPYKKWLDCDVSWIFSEETVGPSFSIKALFHGVPVSGRRISLSKNERVVATARTNPNGIARFVKIPDGSYWPESPDGLLFPSGDLQIEVKASHASGENVTLDWPNRSLIARILRGKFAVSENMGGPEIPLRNTTIELRDVYTARLVESLKTDANGDYEFVTADAGIYAFRLTLPKQNGAGSDTRDFAVELDPSATEFSVPSLIVVQSDCAGIQLFRRSPKDDSWQQQ